MRDYMNRPVSQLNYTSWDFLRLVIRSPELSTWCHTQLFSQLFRKIQEEEVHGSLQKYLILKNEYRLPQINFGHILTCTTPLCLMVAIILSIVKLCADPRRLSSSMCRIFILALQSSITTTSG